MAVDTDINAAPSLTTEATCVRLYEKAENATSLAPVLEARCLRPSAGEAIVKVEAAAVNPSDVKAATGLMPYAVFPRTPGRDFAGVVVRGPAEWMGKAVFGTSGDLGVRRDGTHATHLVIEPDALIEKPARVTMEEAAGIGVPFVTAIEGFRRTGMPKPGQHVLIMGINGKVGQAAAQIATWKGAKVIGVVRKDEGYAGHASSAIAVVNSDAVDVAGRVRELTDGKGAEIVFNTVGDAYFSQASLSLAKGGCQILIAAVRRIVEFDILAFHRGRHTYVGVDTLAFSSIESARILRKVITGFADGSLRPFPIRDDAIYSLNRAKQAYQAVIGSSRNRIVLRPRD
jgi:NADPH:quinone reductase-like Zn-dependent oxidoreductase